MQCQHGAVTLVGALFLILCIIVLLGAVQRMAASSITDSALHNDGVEALFIAESGLERAAWRYSAGSACSTLAGEADGIGRGTFTIQSAGLVGTECRVRVSGSVMTTIAANTVTRTIDGDLAVNGGGWAVGDVDGGELILRWDGSSWSRTGPYAGIPDMPLSGVYCVTGSDCWAVGDDSGGELIIHWDGSSWSRAGPYGGVPDRKLFSVHCVASDDCWAAGEKDGSSANLNHWNGSSWSGVASGSVPGKDLAGVHCAAGNDCWAVGIRSGYENISHWDGSAWTRLGNSPGVANKDLQAVYMVSTTEGYLVGQNGTIASWNGSNWAGLTSPTGSDLNAVYVSGGGSGSGSVMLVRWSEVIQ